MGIKAILSLVELRRIFSHVSWYSIHQFIVRPRDMVLSRKAKKVVLEERSFHHGSLRWLDWLRRIGILH